MKYVLLLVFILNLLYSAPSAFGAGDLSSKTPYGLTTTEKAILENKKKLKLVTSKYIFQNQDIKNIKNELLTLKSLISSNLSSSDRLKKDLNKRIFDLENKKIFDLENKINEINSRLKYIETATINLNKSTEALKISFLALKDIILNINENFVSQEELSSIKSLIPKKKKSKISNKKRELLAHKAYKKKKYSKAKELYEVLLKNKYHPAKSSFYLGEISFYQKKYKKAIDFYTKSVNLYAKAKYMSLLLYHTAMSYVYTGNKKQAKDFFDSVIVNFPKSKASKWSKKEIKKRY